MRLVEIRMRLRTSKFVEIRGSQREKIAYLQDAAEWFPGNED